ncbi:glycosyltransferase family 4 protein [Tianweitania sediminis]|uniref:Glycosyltransferase family 4 protein n=1 Tax=Tianweitania sediminis TaxID=1502156 RepID=A0A8J7UKN7_9HYPH|nr:glycosyltransferase family 4 protein [Tianweitania sediminis]MBP0441363.1 glycosyltransferase family 4 protein [Tianweitania sediminis]
MRILIYSHGHPALSPGGAESASYALFERLKSEPDVEVLYVAAGLEKLAGSGRETMFFRGKSDELLLSLPKVDPFSLCSEDPRSVVERLDPIVREFRPDVIHMHHFLGVGLQAVPWLRSQASALVLTLHEYLVLCHNHGQMIKTNGALCFRNSAAECAGCFPEKGVAAFFAREMVFSEYLEAVDRFVSPSRFMLERFCPSPRWSEVRFQQIDNILAPAASGDGTFGNRRKGDKLRLGFFGRYTSYKGLDVLLEAISRLKPSYRKRLSVGVHGGGLESQPTEYRKKVRHLASQSADAIVDHGPYLNSQAGRLMARYDWIVVPSIWWENSPVVIQEALAAGVPVICGDDGGMAEKVVDGVDGLHFSLGSSADLADLLAAIIGGDVEAPKVDHRKVQSGSTQAFEEHLRLYRELAGSPNSVDRDQAQSAL